MNNLFKVRALCVIHEDKPGYLLKVTKRDPVTNKKTGIGLGVYSFETKEETITKAETAAKLLADLLECPFTVATEQLYMGDV